MEALVSLANGIPSSKERGCRERHQDQASHFGKAASWTCPRWIVSFSNFFFTFHLERKIFSGLVWAKK